MKFLVLGGTLGLTAAVAACAGPGAPASTLTISVDSSGPTRIVRIAGDPPLWRLDSLARIGSADEGPQAFGRVRSVLLDREGRAYVADIGNRVVLVFGPDGRFERQLGREGAGPAEYREPYSLAWLGDTLALFDPMNSRIGLFNPDGSWAGSWRGPRLTGGYQVRLYRIGPTSFASFDFRPAADGRQAERVFVRWTPSGTADSAAMASFTPDPGSFVRCEAPNRGIGFYSNPYAPTLVQTPAPDGTIAAAMTDRYRLAFLNPSGDTTRVIERGIEPPLLTDEEWAPVDSGFRAFREQWRGSTCTASALERPARRPPLRDLVYDDEGRLWVDAAVPGGFRFEVFAADGRLLGAVEAPRRQTSVEPSVVAGRLAVVDADSLGVQYVRIFRISSTPVR